MSGTLQVRSVLSAAVANGAYLDIRPPAGEAWLLATVNRGPSGGAGVEPTMYYKNASGLSTLTMTLLAGAVQPVIDNGTYVSAYNGSGAAAVMCAVATLVPSPLSGLAFGASVAAGGTVDIKPPAGTMYLVKAFSSPNSASGSIRYVSGATTYGTLASDSTYNNKPLKIPVTNSTFLRFTNGAAGAQHYYVGAVSMADTMLNVYQSTWAPTVSGAVLDIVPPANETWLLTALGEYYAGTYANLRVGGVNYPMNPFGSGETVPLDSNTTLRMVATGTDYISIGAIKTA